MATLTFLGSFGPGNDECELLATFDLAEGVIGSGEGCWLRFRDPGLVREHARFFKRDEAWYVGGVAVAAQTRVNEIAIEPGKGVRLENGDVVEVADTRLRFGGAPRPIEVDLSTVESAMISADRLSEHGHPAGERIALGQDTVEGWLAPDLARALDTQALELTFRFGMIVGARLRVERDPVHLRQRLLHLLTSPLSVGLEALVVDVFTSPDPIEAARLTCQALVESAPPSLRSVSLGTVESLDVQRLGLDWVVLQRQFPSVPSVGQSVRFGKAVVVVEALGEARGVDVGDHRDLVENRLEFQFGGGQEVEGDDEFGGGSIIVFWKSGGPIEVFAEGVELALTLNSRRCDEGRLRDGDVIDCRGARLRVEFR